MSRVVVLSDIEDLGTPRDRDLFHIGATDQRHTRATQRLVVLMLDVRDGLLRIVAVGKRNDDEVYRRLG